MTDSFTLSIFFHGVVKFAVYFIGALGMCAFFCVAYTRITPHREFELIARHNNAAALAFGGAFLGFAIALAGAIHVCGSILEFMAWGAVAFLAQLFAYALSSYIHPELSRSIEEGHVAAGIWTAAVSLSAGVLIAACMSP